MQIFGLSIFHFATFAGISEAKNPKPTNQRRIKKNGSTLLDLPFQILMELNV